MHRFLLFILKNSLKLMNLPQEREREKAPKGISESLWGLYIVTFRGKTLISQSRRLEVMLLVLPGYEGQERLND
jgi:hypothetical protein